MAGNLPACQRWRVPRAAVDDARRTRWQSASAPSGNRGIAAAHVVRRVAGPGPSALRRAGQNAASRSGRVNSHAEARQWRQRGRRGAPESRRVSRTLPPAPVSARTPGVRSSRRRPVPRGRAPGRRGSAPRTYTRVATACGCTGGARRDRAARGRPTSCARHCCRPRRHHPTRSSAASLWER